MNELENGGPVAETPEKTNHSAPLKPGAMTSEFWLIVVSLATSITLDCLGKLPAPWLAVASIVLPIVFASLRTLAKNEHAGRLHAVALTLLEAQEERLKGMASKRSASALPDSPVRVEEGAK